MSNLPDSYLSILKETNELGFEQLSDECTGSLLSTLCGSKINGVFLELGTGTGLSTSWILYGMSSSSKLMTVDNDKGLIEIAKKHLGLDTRVEFIISDGEELINKLTPLSIDLIFADTWPGKYNHLEEESHTKKALELEKTLRLKNNFTFTKLNWSTGLMVGVKNA